MNRKYKMYNNGILTIRVYEGDKIPDGYTLGICYKRIPWNKGLSKETDERVKNNIEKCHNTRKLNNSYIAWNKGLTKDTDSRVHGNSGETNGMYGKHPIPWNKGLTADSDKRVFNIRENIRLTFIDGRLVWNKGLSKENNEILNKVSKLWTLDNRLLNKRRETLIKNGTLGILYLTKPELEFYNKLKIYFKEEDIMILYLSDEYPFKADFYIKSLDCYIECNYYPTHGNHPYTNSELDRLLLEELDRINSDWSEAIKYQWTDLDIRKRNIAILNNLNYLMIYKDVNDEDIVYALWRHGEENKTPDIMLRIISNITETNCNLLFSTRGLSIRTIVYIGHSHSDVCL